MIRLKNYIMIRILATSFAIKRGRFTQDSGFDCFVGSDGGGQTGAIYFCYNELILNNSWNVRLGPLWSNIYIDASSILGTLT